MNAVPSLDAVDQLDARVTLELSSIEARIRGRDEKLLSSVRTQYLETGRDLSKAKAIVGHKNFRRWCNNQLGYTIRKAELLMRAAEMLGHLLENENVSLLPPPAVAYALSAPSLPREIRDEFLPRALAGERVGPGLRRAIKAHRAAVKGEVPAHDTPIAEEREHLPDPNEERGEHASQTEDEGRAATRSATVNLIVEQVGDRLPELIELVVQAGSGVIFSHAVERELMTRGTAPAVSAGDCGDAPDDGGTASTQNLLPPPKAPCPVSGAVPTSKYASAAKSLHDGTVQMHRSRERTASRRY